MARQAGESLKDYNARWRKENRTRLTMDHGEWVKENRESVNKTVAKTRSTRSRHSEVVKSHGITIEQYAQMFSSQNGTCFICKNPPKPTRRLAVDHDHGTGKVRALLCDVCNRHLGVFERKKSEFMAYLEKFS